MAAVVLGAKFRTDRLAPEVGEMTEGAFGTRTASTTLDGGGCPGVSGGFAPFLTCVSWPLPPLMRGEPGTSGQNLDRRRRACRERVGKERRISPTSPSYATVRVVGRMSSVMTCARRVVRAARARVLGKTVTESRCRLRTVRGCCRPTARPSRAAGRRALAGTCRRPCRSSPPWSPPDREGRR